MLGSRTIDRVTFDAHLREIRRGTLGVVHRLPCNRPDSSPAMERAFQEIETRTPVILDRIRAERARMNDDAWRRAIASDIAVIRSHIAASKDGMVLASVMLLDRAADAMQRELDRVAS